MGMDKAIKYGKEKREPYYGSKRVDSTCRNHGSCPYCQGSIKYKMEKQKPLVLS